MSSRTAARLGALIATGALVSLVGALPAAAHVVTDPKAVPGGGYGVITFRVPDESATAGTVRVEVTLPTDRPITSARTEPMPGWTAQVQKTPLPAPVDLGGGETATEAVRSVSWTALPGTRIGPGEFAQFRISAGPLPAGPGTLVLPATQTYDDGKVVSWSDRQAPGAPEAEHPAPTLTLTAASPEAGEGGGGAGDDTARWLGGAGLVLGALGAALGIVALGRSRRRPGPTSTASEEPRTPTGVS